METAKEPTPQTSNQKQGRRARRAQIISFLISLAVAIYLLAVIFFPSGPFTTSLFTTSSGKAIDNAKSAARSDGYSVYDDGASIEDSDGYGRYLVDLNARIDMKDVKLIVYIDNINFGQIVCPDTFDTPAIRDQWISNVKLNNDWGNSAK